MKNKIWIFKTDSPFVYFKRLTKMTHNDKRYTDMN